MVIGDVGRAEHVLKHISYYRLRAYWLYFETDPSNPNHQLRSGTTLEAVLGLYNFDRRLRLLLLDAIERIEVASRGSWAHHMAMKYGPHGYLDPSHYSNPQQHTKNIATLKKEVNRSDAAFIVHYRTAYGIPPEPPVWMVSEVMTFGLLSKFQELLKRRADRKAIGAAFGLGPTVYTKFLHHLSTVRNLCAHHSRVWNRRLTVTPTLPTQPPTLAQSIHQAAPRQIYNTLTMMAFVMDTVAPQSRWKHRLVALLGENPVRDIAAMGFPVDWLQRPVWRSASRRSVVKRAISWLDRRFG
jgi:abortive infection bacteriophage resistance protein